MISSTSFTKDKDRMTRYRKTSSTDDRVGRNLTPVATPTPTPTLSKSVQNAISSAIDSKVSATLPEYSDLGVDINIDDFISGLSDTQKRTLAELLRKSFSIDTLKDVDMIISDAAKFTFNDEDFMSFNKFITAVNNQLVYKPSSTGPKESISITKYGPEQIDAWVDNWLTGEVGRTLESVTPEQAKLLRRAVRDYASSESVTKVTKDKKGRAVTTYSPGVSEAGIQEALKTTAEAEFGPEMERRQAFEFGDLLSKTLGIGSI